MVNYFGNLTHFADVLGHQTFRAVSRMIAQFLLYVL